MKIRYVDFWNSFDPNDNFFTKYLEYFGYCPEVVLNKGIEVDLEIHSVFRSTVKKKMHGLDRKLNSKSYLGSNLLRSSFEKRLKQLGPAKKHLWFTGENTRPPYDMKFDRFLSFDQFNFDSRNFYFPLWFTHLDWFGSPEYNSRVGTSISASTLSRSRTLNSEKRKFACIFLSNPHPYRLQVINKFRENFEIDVYGSYSGRKIPHKLDVSREYKFTICFENDIYPGYVTEKIVEAYISETIPVYWGDFGRDSIFNPKSFFNLADFTDLSSLMDALINCDYEKMYSEPLFIREFDFLEFNNFFQDFLNT